MAKSVHADVLDGALAVIKSNAQSLAVLSSAPASYGAATTATLASAATGSGDFTLGAGGTSGRKLTVAAKSGVSIGASGTATHVALLDPVASRVLYVTTCPATALTMGGTVNVADWAIEIADPA